MNFRPKNYFNLVNSLSGLRQFISPKMQVKMIDLGAKFVKLCVFDLNIDNLKHELAIFNQNSRFPELPNNF